MFLLLFLCKTTALEISLSLYCAGFLCIVVVLSPPAADQIISLNLVPFFFPSIFFLSAHMHPWQGAAWHHLTSPCFLISILTVYQKRNRFGVRVLSTCLSLRVSNSSFALCPSQPRVISPSCLEQPHAIGTSLTSGGTGLWMCCTLCLGWRALQRLRAVPAAALTPERTCWRIPARPQSNNNDPAAV